MLSYEGTALLWCDECHYYHTKPMDCPYSSDAVEAYGTIDERLAEASAADILFDMAQERFGEYND